MHKLVRVLTLAGAFTLLLSLVAATPQMLAVAANTTCNGRATAPGMGGPYTVVCRGTCPNAATCGRFSWTEGTTTKTQCTCGNFVPFGDTECFFTLFVTTNPDGSVSTTAQCVDFNCAAPKACVDQASGPLGGGPWTFQCVCN